MSQPIELRDRGAPATGRLAGSPTAVAAYAVLGLSVGLTCWPLLAIDTFSYRHSWVAAHFATMARGFLDHGFLPLGLVPVQNGGILTDYPYYYLHWPPFFAIFQAWIFALFGTASATAVHALATALVLAQAALAGIWMRRTLSPLAGFVTAVTFLNLPVVAKFDHVGLYLHLALLLLLCAVLVHDHAARHGHGRRLLIFFGAACFALACFTSWEPVLALPGLSAYWLIERTWRAFRLFALYVVSGLVAVATTPILYALQALGAVSALVDRALYRTGLADATASSVRALHTVEEAALGADHHEFGYLAVRHLGGILLHHLPQLGAIGGLALIAVAVLVASRRARSWALRGPVLVLAPLVSPGALWMVLMPQHFYIHEFQALLFAIPAGLAAGFVAQALKPSLLGSADNRAPRPKILLLALVAIAIVGRLGVDATKYMAHDPKDPLVEAGRELARQVPEDAVVSVPWKTMVPTYYSDRHLVRGVDSYVTHLRYADEIDGMCTVCPLYIVLPAQQTAPVPYTPIWRNDRWQLMQIRGAAADAEPSSLRSAPDRE